MERHDNRKRLRLPRLAKYRAFGIARQAGHGRAACRAAAASIAVMDVCS